MFLWSRGVMHFARITLEWTGQHMVSDKLHKIVQVVLLYYSTLLVLHDVLSSKAEICIEV